MIRRLLALVLTLAVVWLVAGAVGNSGPATGTTALALGFTLIAAAITGALLERVGLPRITGYLLAGVLCGPYVGNVITQPLARDLQVFNGLAVALIAFIAGLEMNFVRLRPRLRAMLQFSGVVMGIVYVVMFGVFWILWPWLGLGGAFTVIQRAAIVALLTTIVASSSPTVTIAIIAESRASGPLSELTLGVVVLADLILILLFTFVMQFANFAFGGTSEAGLLGSLSWNIFGSLAFGAAVGWVFALYLRHFGWGTPLALLGLCALIAGVGSRFHLEPLLVALAAGLIVENIAPPKGDVLKNAVEGATLPVLVVFFTAAGAALQLDALSRIGVIAVAVSVIRIFLLWSSARAGLAFTGIDRSVGGLVWMGLVSQAGVTLGLTLIVAAEYPEWGATVQTLMVGLIALHELAGPVLFRAALARAGEIETG